MARLLTLNDFRITDNSHGTLDPSWYFPDAHFFYNSQNRGTKFTVESGYPFQCAIHFDKISARHAYRDDDAASLRVNYPRLNAYALSRGFRTNYLVKNFSRFIDI